MPRFKCQICDITMDGKAKGMPPPDGRVPPGIEVLHPEAAERVHKMGCYQRCIDRNVELRAEEAARGTADMRVTRNASEGRVLLPEFNLGRPLGERSCNSGNESEQRQSEPCGRGARGAAAT